MAAIEVGDHTVAAIERWLSDCNREVGEHTVAAIESWLITQ